MKPDFQRRIQRYGWDKAARHYEKGWQKQLWPAQKRLIKVAGCQPGEEVLDISCGTGLSTFPMAKAVGSNGSVTGVDISEGMIVEAAAMARERGIDNVSFHRMDAEALELPDASFDVAVNSLGLMYVPDPDRALREMNRVLRPGGRALALVWGRRRECGWAEIFPIVDRRVASDVCPMFYQLGTGQNLQRSFEQAGFDNLKTDRFNVTLKFESEEEALTGAFMGGPVALAYGKFSEAVRQEVHAEYLESIEPYRNGSGYDIPGEFVIVAGVKKCE
jgi:ubiquinone/menaquinone biosynthesis C-methylase UbiE